MMKFENIFRTVPGSGVGCSVLVCVDCEIIINMRKNQCVHTKTLHYIIIPLLELLLHVYTYEVKSINHYAPTWFSIVVVLGLNSATNQLQSPESNASISICVAIMNNIQLAIPVTTQVNTLDITATSKLPNM